LRHEPNNDDLMRSHAGLAVDPESSAGALDALVEALQSAHSGSASARESAIEQLDRWLARGYEPPELSREEARLITAARWMLNDRPDHPVIPVWAARTAKVLRDLDDEPLAAQLGSFSFEYSIRVGDFTEAGRLVAEMRDRTASNWDARLNWLSSAALYLWLSGRPDAALAELKPAFGDPRLPPPLRYALLEQAASASLVRGDAAGCLRYLDDADALPEQRSAQDIAHLWFLRSGAASIARDQAGAVAAMERCQETAQRVDARFFKALWRLGAAVVRLKSDQARRAERDLTELLGDVVLMRARYLEWSVRLARACARLALNRRPASEADLAAALRIAGRNGYVTCDPWGMTPRFRFLLDIAVERGIEAGTARAILAQYAS